MTTNTLQDRIGGRQALLDELLASARHPNPPTMAIAWPLNKEALLGAMEARRGGLVTPIFFGPKDRIHQAAKQFSIDITGVKILEASDEEEACNLAAWAVGRGDLDILAKGSSHSDCFLGAVLNKEHRLRKNGIVSHIFYIKGIPPRHGELTPRTMIITDGALNIAPSLKQKRDIAQNAIDFLISMGVETPRVAVLAAVETVNSDMPATIDAAALSMMSLRGQITGGIVDGPLAMDSATNPEAVRTKGIRSSVAGKADILLCPTIEVANVAAKEYEHMNVLSAGILCGTQKPVVVTSRADGEHNRLASVAIACILSQQLS